MRTVLLFAALTIAKSALATELDAQVDQYLNPYLETRNFQGVILVAKGDEVLLEKGYGSASIELDVANTPETVFHIASVSKPFTAAGILLLVEDGKVDLHQPLDEIIPEYPHAQALTLHHLLSHTSGIPNINSLDVYSDVQKSAQTPESLLEYFRELPLEFEPGEKYAYSNSNYNLLALAIERLSQLSFGEFLQSSVLEPAGTVATAHDSSATTIIENRAEGYAPAGLFDVQRAPWLDWTAKTGNGSMIATASDLLLWSRAFFDDRIVSSENRSLMTSNHTPSSGYGWFIYPRHGRTQFHINGRSPGFSSYLGYYPEEDVTVIVLSNLYNSVTTSIGSDLAAMVFGVPYEVSQLSADRLDDATIEGISGRYQYGSDFYNPDVVVTIEVRDGFVHQLWGTSGFQTALIPQGGDKFVDRAFWSDVQFVRDDSGTVIEVHFDGFVAHRVEEAPN